WMNCSIFPWIGAWYASGPARQDRARPPSTTTPRATGADAAGDQLSAATTGWSRPQTRQQRQRVAALDRLALGIRHLGVMQLLEGLGFHERIIGAEQDVARRSHGAQSRDGCRPRRVGGVVIELAQFSQHPIRHDISGIRPTPERLRHTARDHWRRAAAVRENKPDLRVLHQGAVDQQAGDGTRGIEWKFDRLWLQARNHAAAAGRHGRMEIDHGLAAIELLEYRREGRVAGILAVIG